jgi:hypothetical protein
VKSITPRGRWNQTKDDETKDLLGNPADQPIDARRFQMIQVRNVFQAKYGKGDELVHLLKEGQAMWPSGRNGRILTDLSGPFFTVVGESEWDSYGAWEASSEVLFGDPRFAAWFEHMTALVESGRREFYSLVD